MAKTKIGVLLVPSAIHDLPMLLDELVFAGFVPQIVMPHQRLEIDALVIPDSKAYNLTTMGCTPHMVVPISRTKGQDQYVEAFRIQSLDFYRRRGTVIVGLGTSACLLYDDLTGGKIEWKDRMLQPKGAAEESSSKSLFYKEPLPHFVTDCLIGMWTISQIDAQVIEIVKRQLAIVSPPDEGSNKKTPLVLPEV